MPNLPAPAALTDRLALWATPGRFALLTLAFLFAAFPQVFLGQETFFFRDYAMFGYPLAHYHRECFWRGELPLWNPLSDCGLPYLAQWNTMVLYPGTLIYLLLPLPQSLGYYCLAHLFWAALGMYWLARFWTRNALAAAIAGTAFAFNGLALNCLMWPNNIATYAWMPWVFYFTCRAWREGGRRVVYAAWIGALQMLAGTPEIILMTWGVIGAVWALEWWQDRPARKPYLLRFGALIALVSGLVAAQVLPFAELLRHAHRTAGYSDDSWAMPPWGWANFLVPHFYTWRLFHGVLLQLDQGWTSSYYAGVGVLALALLAFRQPAATIRLMAGLVLVALVLALGPDGHLYSWIKRVLPQIGIVRFPVKFVLPVLFLLPLLAAAAWARLDSISAEAWRKERNGLLGITVGLLLGITGVALFAHVYPYGENDAVVNAATRTLFLAGIVLALWWWKQSAHLPAGLAVVCLIWLDGITHVPNQNPTVNPAVYEPGLTRQSEVLRPGQARLMSRHDTEYRVLPSFRRDPVADVLSKRVGAYASCNLLDGVPKLTGMFSLHLREMYELQAILYDRPDNLAAPLGDFLGVALAPKQGEFTEFAPRSQYLPLATAGQRPVFESPGDTLGRLNTPQFDPRREVCLPPEAQPLVRATSASPATVKLVAFENERLEWEVQTERPAWVVIAQSYYPAWTARVDGIPAKIWRANYAFQAVEIPAGARRLELRYEDQAFRAGIVVSLCALVVSLLALRIKRQGG